MRSALNKMERRAATWSICRSSNSSTKPTGQSCTGIFSTSAATPTGPKTCSAIPSCGALQAAPRYKGGEVKAWLFGLARNVWRENLRRRKQALPYDDLLGLTREDTLAEDAAARQALERVETLLDEKGPPAAEVVRLRAAGYAYAEIAAKLKITESSARVLEHRTRRWLQTTLQKEGLWYAE